MNQTEMSNLYRGPAIDASYQVSYYLVQRLQRKSCFRNRPIRNKNCLWWPYLLMDRDEMSNLYRGPAIDASYQVSVHLAKRFQRRRFKVALSTIKLTNQPNSFYHVLLNRRDFRCLFVVALFIQLLFRIIILVQIFTFKVFFFCL